MSNPICSKCGGEIVPGDLVEFVGLEGPARVRLLVSDDDVLLVHLTCPEREES